MRLRMRKRDQRLLLRIASYGHITLEVMQLWFPEMSKTALESWIKRLRDQRLPNAAFLDARRKYYRLSELAVMTLRRQLGVRVSKAAARPRKPGRKAERHGALLYCCQHEGRSFYRPSLDRRRFPDIAEHIANGKADPLRQKLFYAEGAVVGYFVLDQGQTTFIASKLSPKLLALAKWRSFQQLVEGGEFRLTVAAVAEARATQLRQALSDDAPPFAWEVVVISEVADLVLNALSSKAHPKENAG